MYKIIHEIGWNNPITNEVVAVAKTETEALVLCAAFRSDQDDEVEDYFVQDENGNVVYF